MLRLSSRRRSRPARQRGFSLLEVLIALLLVGFWTLGSARMLTSTTQLEKTAEFRSAAVILASDLLERMEANKTAASTGAYVYSGTSSDTPPACSAVACSATDLATFDLAEWQAKLNTRLPSATVAVTSPAAGNPFSYTVTINWSDRRTAQTYATTGTTETFAYAASRTFFSQ